MVRIRCAGPYGDVSDTRRGLERALAACEAYAVERLMTRRQWGGVGAHNGGNLKRVAWHCGLASRTAQSFRPARAQRS